ncbi:MAG: transporter associated domain-containing protein, partial [Myxococcota bacterium]|nr:transporter associated domain-containing protein [Myxococcota bacterium]
TAIGPDHYTVHGAMDIVDFAERMGVHLPDGEYSTVGDFILAMVDGPPERGSRFDAGGLRFVVSALDGRAVTEVNVTLTPADATEELSPEEAL